MAAEGSSTAAPRGRAELLLPQSVRDAIGRRLDALTPACNEMLRAASVLGRAFGAGTLGSRRQLESGVRSFLRLGAAGLVAGTLGCDAGPVRWEPSVLLDASLQGAQSLAFDSAGQLRASTAPSSSAAPASAGQCRESVQVAGSSTGVRYATWWSVRADSGADLVATTSVGGGAWREPQRVDTLDVSKTGCRRPPPAIVADGDNVHIAYPMIAREGPGIFLTHSMDRGAIYHYPVAVVYGEKPGLASVAARGNFVVVAYEDPNSSPQRISVAISSTMAHIFQFRQAVSPPGGAVGWPAVVTDGRQVTATCRPSVTTAGHPTAPPGGETACRNWKM